jgi:hypothetical protein
MGGVCDPFGAGKKGAAGFASSRALTYEKPVLDMQSIAGPGLALESAGP